MKYNQSDNESKPKIIRLSESLEFANYELNTEKFFVLELMDILKNCYINNAYKGYELILDACRIIYKNNFGHLLITKDIYCVLGKAYNIPSAQVEHSIRTAITCGYREYSNKEIENEVYSRFDKRPSNNKFLNEITTLAFTRMRSI